MTGPAASRPAGPTRSVSDRSPVRPRSGTRSLTGDAELPVIGLPATRPGVVDHPEKGSDLGGQPDGEPPVSGVPVADREPWTPSVRRSDPDTEELLEIARSAVRTQDKLTCKVAAQAIHGQQVPLPPSDTLTALMAQLRAPHGQPVTSAWN